MTTLISAQDALARLHAFEAQRATRFTGSLMGLDLPARDRLLAAEFAVFDAELEAARVTAAVSGQPVPVDGSRVSLTETGDTWTVHPDGHMSRELSTFPGFEELLDQLASPPELDRARPLDDAELFEVCYQGFWSPSATNWQPTRVVVLEGALRDRLAPLAGWEPGGALPLLVTLRRDHYESLLGDAMEPFGLQVTAREESIDAGIYAATMGLAALARGLTFAERVLEAPARGHVAAWLDEELERRLGLLSGEDEAIARERAKLQGLLERLREGHYLVDSLVMVGHPRVPMATGFQDFDALVAAHATQRVASPEREFAAEATQRLWELARRVVPDASHMAFVYFHRSQQTPGALGQAMFEALYGRGADAETKAGGEGGLLTAVTVGNYLRNQDALRITAELGEGWHELPEAELVKRARGLAVVAGDLGPYMRDRILRDGKYRVEGDRIVDGAGKLLTVPVLVRLNRALAATFGNFFLKFQNTHPQNGVLLAAPGPADPHPCYRQVGKVAAAMTFLARAWGATSILKTGPIDLAREELGRILRQNLDGLPELARLAPGLLEGAWTPALTFQVGMPLAGSEIVEAGTPQAHTGLEERRRDKRPPRARFADHYCAAY